MTLQDSSFIESAKITPTRTTKSVMAVAFLKNYETFMAPIEKAAQAGLPPYLTSKLSDAVIHKTVGVTLVSSILDNEFGIKFASVESATQFAPEQAQLVQAMAENAIKVIQSKIDALTKADLPSQQAFCFTIHEDDLAEWALVMNKRLGAIVDKENGGVLPVTVTVELLRDPEFLGNTLLECYGDIGLGLASNITVVPYELVKAMGLEESSNIYRLNSKDAKFSEDSMPDFNVLMRKCAELAHEIDCSQYTDKAIRRAMMEIKWDDSPLIGVLLSNIGTGPGSKNEQFVSAASIIQKIDSAIISTFRSNSGFYDLLENVRSFVQTNVKTVKRNVIPAEGEVRCHSTKSQAMKRTLALTSDEQMGEPLLTTQSQKVILGLGSVTSRASETFALAAKPVYRAPQGIVDNTPFYSMALNDQTVVIPGTIDFGEAIKEYNSGVRYANKLLGTHINLSDFLPGHQATHGAECMFSILRHASALKVNYSMLPLLQRNSIRIQAETLELLVPSIPLSEAAQATANDANAIAKRNAGHKSDITLAGSGGLGRGVLMRLWTTNPSFIADYVEEVARNNITSFVHYVEREIPTREFKSKSMTLIEYLIKRPQMMMTFDTNAPVVKDVSGANWEGAAQPVDLSDHTKGVHALLPLACTLVSEDFDAYTTLIQFENTYFKYLLESVEQFTANMKYSGVTDETLAAALAYMSGNQAKTPFVTFRLALTYLRDYLGNYQSPADVALIIYALLSKTTLAQLKTL